MPDDPGLLAGPARPADDVRDQQREKGNARPFEQKTAAGVVPEDDDRSLQSSLDLLASHVKVRLDAALNESERRKVAAHR